MLYLEDRGFGNIVILLVGEQNIPCLLRSPPFPLPPPVILLLRLVVHSFHFFFSWNSRSFDYNNPIALILHKIFAAVWKALAIQILSYTCIVSGQSSCDIYQSVTSCAAGIILSLIFCLPVPTFVLKKSYRRGQTESYNLTLLAKSLRWAHGSSRWASLGGARKSMSTPVTFDVAE